MRVKIRLLMILGVVVALLPYLGVPLFWKRVLTSIIGIAIAGLAVLLRLTLRSIREKLRPATMDQSDPNSQQPYETTS